MRRDFSRYILSFRDAFADQWKLSLSLSFPLVMHNVVFPFIFSAALTMHKEGYNHTHACMWLASGRESEWVTGCKWNGRKKRGWCYRCRKRENRTWEKRLMPLNINTEHRDFVTTLKRTNDAKCTMYSPGGVWPLSWKCFGLARVSKRSTHERKKKTHTKHLLFSLHALMKGISSTLRPSAGPLHVLHTKKEKPVWVGWLALTLVVCICSRISDKGKSCIQGK